MEYHRNIRNWRKILVVAMGIWGAFMFTLLDLSRYTWQYWVILLALGAILAAEWEIS